MRPFVCSILGLMFSFPAIAESPLGITGAEFRLGAVAQDTGAAQASLGGIQSFDAIDPVLGFAAVNVAVTDAHGFQGDVLLEDGPGGAIGRLGAHVFMTPQSGQKYGLFAILSRFKLRGKDSGNYLSVSFYTLRFQRAPKIN